VETERLAAIPLFSSLPAEELAAVASVAGECDAQPGNTVCKEGDFGHTVFAVESGTADVLSDGVTIATVGPGDVIGEIAVLASGRRTASVVATSPMRLISFFKRDVWALEKRAPIAAGKLRELIGEHQTPAGA
jgi:CRP/FNR family transcriptional regulator, cyclic AMP receptor protein